MENTEIIFKCNSVNNKNIRANELKILEKHTEAYVGKKFEYEESSEVLNSIIDFLRKSHDEGRTVMVSLK